MVGIHAAPGLKGARLTAILCSRLWGAIGGSRSRAYMHHEGVVHVDPESHFLLVLHETGIDLLQLLHHGSAKRKGGHGQFARFRTEIETGVIP